MIIMHGRPVVAGSDSFSFQVQLTHRITWKRDSSAGGMCTQAIVNAQTLLSGEGQLRCQSGCSGNIAGLSYYCTDFSETDNWSAGERRYVYYFTEPSFEAR